MIPKICQNLSTKSRGGGKEGRGGIFPTFGVAAFPNNVLTDYLFKNYVRIFGIWVLEPKVLVQNTPIIQPGIMLNFCPKWGYIG